MLALFALVLPILAAADGVPAFTPDCSRYANSEALASDIINGVNKLQAMSGSASDTSGDGCNRVFYQRDGINENEGSAIYLCADGGTATVSYSTIGNIVSVILNSCTDGPSNQLVHGVGQFNGYSVEVHHFPVS